MQLNIKIYFSSLGNAIAALNGTSPNRSVQQALELLSTQDIHHLVSQADITPEASEAKHQNLARKILADASGSNTSDVLERLQKQDAEAASLKEAKTTDLNGWS